MEKRFDISTSTWTSRRSKQSSLRGRGIICAFSQIRPLLVEFFFVFCKIIMIIIIIALIIFVIIIFKKLSYGGLRDAFLLEASGVDAISEVDDSMGNLIKSFEQNRLFFSYIKTNYFGF